jgi:competence protein ComEA
MTSLASECRSLTHPEERMTTSRRIWSSVLVFTLSLATASLGSVATATARGSTEMNTTATVGDKAGHGDKININTADVKELMKLAGVHKKTAEKIVEYRQAHGLFKKPEEVVKVDGIGHALFEKNRARIVVE